MGSTIVLRKKEEERKREEKIKEVQNKLKPFLRDCILRVFDKRVLRCTRDNIRMVIRECRDNPNFRNGLSGYNPFDILFTEKEWYLFRKECNEIFLVVNAPKRKVGVFDKDPNGCMGCKDNLFTGFLRELRDAPMKDWIFQLEEWWNKGSRFSMITYTPTDET